MATRKRDGRAVAASIGTGIAAIGVVFATQAFAGGDPDSAEAARAKGCVTITVAASSEKSRIMQDLAEGYNSEHATGDDCSYVDVQSVPSGTAAAAFAEDWDAELMGFPTPEVWAPTSSSWTGTVRLGREAADLPAILPQEYESVAQSPLVLAMPKPMAEALGWPDAPIGWETVLQLAQSPDGWGSLGHPEWGPFTLGKTNPEVSTFGFEATVASYYAATGLSSDLQASDVHRPEVVEFVAGIEDATAHYGPLSEVFLTNLWKADNEGRAMGYVSAVPLAEKNIFDYNAGDPDGKPDTDPSGKPKVPLVAVYPSDGTSVFDHPYLVLDSPNTTQEQRALAVDFREYLQQAEQQAAFMAGGFRSFEGESGGGMTPEHGILPNQPSSRISMPAPNVLAETLDSWEDVRKPARVLLVIDASGSMGAPVEGTGKSRLELAQEAAISSLGELNPRDEVGVWVFSTRTGQGPGPHVELVEMGPLERNREAVENAIRGVLPQGGTPLYTTTMDAVAAMRASLDPGLINAVILLSDGQNDHTFTDFEAVVDSLEVEDRSQLVRVFPIGYGEEADMAALEAIAQASGGNAYDATNASSIEGVMISVLSSF